MENRYLESLPPVLSSPPRPPVDDAKEMAFPAIRRRERNDSAPLEKKEDRWGKVRGMSGGWINQGK